jgi:hypothetical protein
VLSAEFSLAQRVVTLNFDLWYHVHTACLDGIYGHFSPLDKVFRDTHYISKFGTVQR